MIRTQSYRPQLTTLESRLQPGSVFTGIIDTSLFAANLGLLGQSLLAPVSQAQESAPAAAVATPARTSADLSPALPIDLGLQSQPQAPLASQFAALDQGLVNAVQAIKVQPNAIPPGGGTHVRGGACEDLGNVVINGDFEAGGAPWFTNDPYAGIGTGGGDLTPDHHLALGYVGDPGGRVWQEGIATEPDMVYNVRVSLRTDDGGPRFLKLEWNDVEIVDLTANLGSTYVRDIWATVTGTGSDKFAFFERHDPAWIRVDDVCITPAV